MNLRLPWTSKLPTYEKYGHEKTLSIRTNHHKIVYAYSSHRSSHHKKLRSSFFLSWSDYEQAAIRVIDIPPIGPYYTMTPSTRRLHVLLHSGKPITHERAHTLRLNGVGELVDNNISLPMAMKIAELDLLLRLRSGTPQSRNSRGCALSLLALFRVQHEKITSTSGRDAWPSQHVQHQNLLNEMRTQYDVFGDVLLANFSLHCTDEIDQLRALELYEIVARMGMGLGAWPLAAQYWSKLFECLTFYYGK
jgi:hypothetical protein